jgi:diguanylate cyclase (GGDEF)-like protein
VQAAQGAAGKADIRGTMKASADDQVLEGTLSAMKLAFYSGELPAAMSAGHALLAAMDPETLDTGRQSTRARVLLWLVRCARRADEFDGALVHTYTGIAAARAAGDARLECLLRAQHVHVLASLGQNEAAMDEGYKVLRLAVDSGDTLGQAECWLALARVHWTMQQWPEVEQAFTRAQTLGRLCDDMEICGLATNGIATTEEQHAAVARAAGRADEAQANARRALDLMETFTRISLKIGDAYHAWIGGYNQASCLFAMGEHEAARKQLQMQLKPLEGERGARHLYIVQLLGDIHLAEGRHDLAIACQTEALELAERLQLPLLAMEACRSLVEAHERRGDHREALAQHRRFHAFYVQLASKKAQAHARALAVMYQTERSLALAEAERDRADRLASANSGLVQEKAMLQRSSMEDSLTGLANRRRFDQALEETLGPDGAPRDRALAMIDVDHFKRINDRFSHLIGDQVLQRLGVLLQRCCRRQDLAARYGGEEFALILVDVDLPAARAACERLRATVEAESWSELHPDLQVTVSIGFVHAEENNASGEPYAMLAVADHRLFSAKHGGRNRVVGAAAD